MMSSNKTVWVLTDNRAGNSKQAVALAEILGLPYKIKKLKYNFLAKLPNFLKFGFLGITTASERSLKGNPDVVISSGRRTATIALALKKRCDSQILQIMNPGISLKHIDVLILPHHDKKPKEKYLTKTLFIHGALTHNDMCVIQDHSKVWEDKFQNFPKPHIAVLLGGKSKNTNFTRINAKTLARLLLKMAEKIGGSLLITTSRRTPRASIEALEQQLKLQKTIPYYLYNFHESSTANPYLGLLGISDKIVVTGDSVSMCSEAVQTLKPVYVFSEVNMISKKHKKYLDHLFAKGVASPLHENYKPFEPKTTISNINLKKKIWAVLQ
jgi:uncharacterized protein